MIQNNKKIKQINKEYFEDYGGDSYSENYAQFTVSPAAVVYALNQEDVDFDTLLDAGCASGELVQDFRNLGIQAYGIENNKDILKRCVCPEYCTQMDLMDLSSIKDNTFDVIYTNALMYLFPQDVLGVLKEFNRICTKAVYLCNPYLETCNFEDPYRKFLATREWWGDQFQKAGFEEKDGDVFLKV